MSLRLAFWIPPRVRYAALALLIASTPVGNALAEDADSAEMIDKRKQVARGYGATGIELYDAGSYAEASENLEKAYSVLRVPTLGLWSGRAFAKLGQLIQAQERFQEVIVLPVEPDEPALFAEARAQSKQELQFLGPRIPTVTVEIHGAPAAEVQVTIDDVEVPHEKLDAPIGVNPGLRRVVGTRGDRVERVTLSLPERATGSVVLDFTPRSATPKPATAPPQDASSTQSHQVSSSGMDQKTWGYIALGVGGAALITGGVFTFLAERKRGDLEENCPNQDCPPEFHGDVDSLNQSLTFSLAGYAGAALGLGLGTVLLLTAPEASAKATDPSWSVWLGPGSATVRGRF